MSIFIRYSQIKVGRIIYSAKVVKFFFNILKKNLNLLKGLLNL